jgi:hypothetical protein
VPKRRWEMDAESERPEGWLPDTGAPVAEVNREDYASEEELDDALFREVWNLVWTLKRFGGIFSAGALREELGLPGSEIWETKRFVFGWDSYAPGQRQKADPEPTAEAPAEPEAEPVPA